MDDLHNEKLKETVEEHFATQLRSQSKNIDIDLHSYDAVAVGVHSHTLEFATSGSVRVSRCSSTTLGRGDDPHPAADGGLPRDGPTLRGHLRSPFDWSARR